MQTSDRQRPRPSGSSNRQSSRPSSRQLGPPPRRRPSPRYRPPWLLRALVGMVAIGAVLFTVALMWSDRAPGVLEPLLSERARQLWVKIDPQRLADQGVTVSRADLPRTDFMLHVTIWTVVSSLVITTWWTWRGLVLGAIGVAFTSYLIELGQGRFSTNRTVDIADAIANTIGVACGALIALVLFVLWNAAGHILAGLIRPAPIDRRR